MTHSDTLKTVLQVITTISFLLLITGCGGGGGGGGGSSYTSIYTALAAADLDLDGVEDIAEPRWRFKVRGTGTGFEATGDQYLATIALQDSLNLGVFVQHDTRDADGRLDKLDGYPASIDVGDINNDMFPDLVIAIISKDVTNRVNISLQNSNDAGRFLPHSFAVTEPNPTDVAIGDLDGDGINDIAVASEPLTLLINDPVTPGADFTASSIPVNASSVAVGDIDKDGRIDIVATGSDAGDDNVYVILQEQLPDPPGLFLSITSYPVGSNPMEVITADLNGDTLLDLAIVNEGLNVGSVSVLLQDTNMRGTFMAQAQYPTDSGSEHIDAGDLNGDLLPDLVVSNSDAENLSIIFQDDLLPGSFEPAETLAVRYDDIFDVVIGEFTGDLLLDIATAAQKGVFVHAQDANNPGAFLPGKKI